MRGKNFNAGLRGVLFEARHYERMGSAVWLYGWLVLRQTHQSGETGWVLGGKPVRYREIEEETGFPRKTLERWMHRLRQGDYIETQAAPDGIIIRITKAKKFSTPNLKNAGRHLMNEEGRPQFCGGFARKIFSSRDFAAPMSSSSEERERRLSPGSGKNQNPRSFANAKPDQRTLWRMERQRREEAVRRELNVGAGPEL